MRLTILMLLCLMADNAVAQIFKHVDPDGTVTYSDVPTTTKDQPVKTAPMTVFTAPPVVSTSGTNAAQKQGQDQYTRLQITSPEDNAAVRANGGNISVTVLSEPPLDTDAGHQYALLLDGQLQSSGQSTSLAAGDVSRGSHTLRVDIRDADGNVLVSSQPIKIDVLRASVLNPNHPNPNIPP